jgi:hypothetical protein
MKKQYIDKETLINRVNAIIINPIENDSYDFGWNNSLENVKAIINTLEVKEVDLEKEYKEFVEDDPVYSKLVNNIVGKAIARHFFELGLKAQKGE